MRRHLPGLVHGLGLVSGDDDEEPSRLHLLPGADVDLGHGAAGGGLHLVLHLHGFDGDQRVAGPHPVTGGHRHLHHRSRQGGHQGAGGQL